MQIKRMGSRLWLMGVLLAAVLSLAGGGRGPDLTRQNAVIAANVEAVIDEAGKNPASIGYVSRSAAESAVDVKILAVNGSNGEAGKGS